MRKNDLDSNNEERNMMQRKEEMQGNKNNETEKKKESRETRRREAAVEVLVPCKMRKHELNSGNAECKERNAGGARKVREARRWRGGARVRRQRRRDNLYANGSAAPFN